jgi:hypothetical protein
MKDRLPRLELVPIPTTTPGARETALFFAVNAIGVIISEMPVMLTHPLRLGDTLSYNIAPEHREGAARTLFHRHAFDWLGQVLNPAAQPRPNAWPAASRLPVWFPGRDIEVRYSSTERFANRTRRQEACPP